MNYPKVLQSSENNQNLSLTVKSLLVLAIVYIVKQLGYEASENEALMIAEIAIVIGAGVGTLTGLVRKIINRDRI